MRSSGRVASEVLGCPCARGPWPTWVSKCSASTSTDPIDADTCAELEALWLEHGILLFRGQDIDAKKQIEFSRIFGPLERHPLEVKIESEHPELFVLESGSNPQRDAAETSFWERRGHRRAARLAQGPALHGQAQPRRVDSRGDRR